jgi:hypothetical protein
MNSTVVAKRTFFWSGIYGIVALVPLYFMEEQLGQLSPPASNRPEQYYGFVVVALAWQFAFLLISRDVRRFRDTARLPGRLERARHQGDRAGVERSDTSVRDHVAAGRREYGAAAA